MSDGEALIDNAYARLEFDNYGRPVWSRISDGSAQGIACGHGGSRYLCKTCEAIARQYILRRETVNRANIDTSLFCG